MSDEVTVLRRPAPCSLNELRALAALPMAVDALIYTPEEFREGERRGLGIFDALRREGVDLL